MYLENVEGKGGYLLKKLKVSEFVIILCLKDIELQGLKLLNEILRVLFFVLFIVIVLEGSFFLNVYIVKGGFIF